LVGLGCVTFCIGIGAVLLFGAFLISLVMVVADVREHRRVSRSALAALVLSVSLPLIFGYLLG
jgi:hypothetical protein